MGNDSNNQSTTNIDAGLTTAEAQRRLEEYGPNEVPEKKNNPLIQFAKKFWGLTPWMLEFTVALEWVFGKYTEAYVIVVLLIFNAVVSYLQEEKANSAVELLRKKLTVLTRVKRDGTWAKLPAREIVPGDVIRLRAGDMAPADAKIVDGQMEVDQSALTGESLPVERSRGESIYSGSIVRSGEARESSQRQA